MSDNELNRPMARAYDMRVLERGPLHFWMNAELYVLDDRNGVFLRSDWQRLETKHLRGLSFVQRTVFSSPSLEEAVAARQEWDAMIKAARLLAGADSA